MNDKPESENEDTLDSPEAQLQDAVEASDTQQLGEILDSISSHEALRQVSMMQSDERDSLITLLTPETAAELIEEAFPIHFRLLVGRKSLARYVAA